VRVAVFQLDDDKKAIEDFDWLWYWCKSITRMHCSALRCVRSHSRSTWNMANLTPL